jgi:apolipoprotein N-acyltransferase
MTNLKPHHLSILTGMLLALAWPPLPTAAILFFAFVPLLMLREQLNDNKKKHLKFFIYVYLSLFIFNLGTTWWVWKASVSGAIMMLILNSLLMSLPFLAYSFTKMVYPKLAGLSLIMYYLAFEYWHFNWSASWPWLTLGKGLSSYNWLIQWYEWTGESGGTLFILCINYWIFKLVLQKKFKQLWQPASLWVACFALSQIVLYSNNPLNEGKSLNCVITQPNIDPYTEKFGQGLDYIEPEIQLEIAIDPTLKLMDKETDLLLLPETAIVGYINEGEIENNFLFEPLRKLSAHSKLNILTGSESFSIYDEDKKPSATARFDSTIHKWFDYFNSAMLVNDGKVQNIYHKSKLVPGVEKMPFSFLEQLSIQLGGSSGSLGVSKAPINFKLKNGQMIAPLICYESVFGEYASEFVKNGANLLAVVTNDAWWGNTPGHKQHLMYGAVRCIETRRQMLRSANTGISAHIDEFGNILQSTKYDEQVAFKCKAYAGTKITFYVRFGDWIGKSSLLSILLLLSVYVKVKTKKAMV